MIVYDFGYNSYNLLYQSESMPKVNTYTKPTTEREGICISQSLSMNSDETDPGQVNKNQKLSMLPLSSSENRCVIGGWGIVKCVTVPPFQDLNEKCCKVYHNPTKSDSSPSYTMSGITDNRVTQG